MKAERDDAKGQVDASGGTELAREMAREAECERLHRERAAIEARLAEIGGRADDGGRDLTGPPPQPPRETAP